MGRTQNTYADANDATTSGPPCEEGRPDAVWFSMAPQESDQTLGFYAHLNFHKENLNIPDNCEQGVTDWRLLDIQKKKCKHQLPLTMWGDLFPNSNT